MPASNNALIKVRAGEIIVREGETDARAYNILSGRVEVYKEEAGRRAVLGELGAGHFFGEMNLVTESVRTASVRAVEDCTLAVITPETFNQLLTRDPQSALPILRALLERLRVMNAKYMSLVANQSIVDAAPIETLHFQTSPALAPKPSIRGASAAASAVTLHAQTPQAREALGAESLAVQNFPFRIGRAAASKANDVLAVNELAIADKPPFTVSRNHCAIDRTPSGGFLVIDRGSTLGTFVNNQRLGGSTGSFEAKLAAGKNSLVLGAQGSPYRFNLQIAA